MNDYQSAVEKVIRCALFADWCQRVLGDDLDESVQVVAEATASLELAARDLTNVIDDLPPDLRPEGWETSPEGKTA